MQEVVQKAREILNKLNPENFEKMVQQFLQLNLEDNADRIHAVTNVIFEKAIDNPSFSIGYARMVCRIPQTVNHYDYSLLFGETL